MTSTKHKYQSMDDSDIYSAVNSHSTFKQPKIPLFQPQRSSRLSLMEYIQRKTTSFSRKESDSTYFSSNLDIADPRKRHINLGIMSNREHLRIYIFNHISVTC